MDIDKSREKSSGLAVVTFRVRCEGLGHGDEVFLVASDDTSHVRGIPLYTSPKSFPWYSLKTPTSLRLSKNHTYKYRYAIYRGGSFHRFECASDGPSDTEVFHRRSIVMDTDSNNYHELSLDQLKDGERYTMSDILGLTATPPDIEKVHVRRTRFQQLSTMHSTSFGTLHKSTSTSSSNQMGTSSHHGLSSSSHHGNKKKVGFKPTPPPLHTNKVKRDIKHLNLNSNDGVIVASAFLPVNLRRSDAGEWSADWDYEALLSMQTHLRVTRVGTVKWRGWHGNTGVEGSPESGVPINEREKVEQCLKPFNCVPVWCPPSQFGEMYNGFCKGVLWPILHNVTTVYSSVPEGKGSDGGGPLDKSNKGKGTEVDDDMWGEYAYDDVTFPIHGDGGREAELWSAYTEVNRQFANTIVQCYNEGDLIWIHGFHLMILPSILTRKIPMAKIGLFLHTPFPSSEIFRTLWCRDDLLRGMINADQVGFHLFEYARHFLTCCRRLLGLTYGMIPDEFGGHNLAIECNGRNVTVTSIHAGIAPPVLDHILTRRATIDEILNIQAEFRDKIIFCAIDRLESLKGIPLKLLGLERFLLRCPQWIGKIVLIQIGISAYERGDDFVKTRKEILTIVKNINSIWPGTVHFKECAESQMKLQQRLALLRAADVCMVTSIRDGLNLIPLEFIHCHKDALTDQGQRDGRPRGLVILSEFSSATRVMRGALHVNPWQISEIANAFYQAVSMDHAERMRRISTASEYVSRVTTQRWALAVMLDLKGVQKNKDVSSFVGTGLGLGYQLIGMDTGFVSLDTRAVVRAFKNSRCRLILLDYGGTIMADENLDQFSRYSIVNKSRDYSCPKKRLLDVLKELCKDTKNIVFVVSGKERHSLMKTLNGIPRLGLAAEHGMFISWPTTSTSLTRRWETTIPDPGNAWRPIAIAIMEVYTSRTQGSYIEETEMKVLWQYRDADPEFGYLQSRELEDHLSNVLRSFSVDVLHGGMNWGGYVEVRPKGVNKGMLSTLVIKNLEKFSNNRIDFMLAVGDDHCDEPMLSVIRQIGRRADEIHRANTMQDPPPPLPATITPVDVSPCDEFVSKSVQVFTCTVGKKPSAAPNYLNDVDEVHELLESMDKAANRRSFSTQDLSSFDNISGSFRSRLPPNFANGTNNETISSGVSRSMSMGNFLSPANSISTFGTTQNTFTPFAPSGSLGQYLEEIQCDEEEDDSMFF